MVVVAATIAATRQLHAEQVSLSGAAYAAECLAKGVPLPPKWGGSPNLWTARGHLSDPFERDPNDTSDKSLEGDISSYQATTAPTGLCVINAHNGGLFSVICQGTNGKACFWEGPNQSRVPPTTAVVLADPSPSVPQTFVKSGTELPGGSNQCTQCHAGQNVFIAHVDTSQGGGGTSPLNLRFLTGWMPPNIWYEPIVATGWRENPGPDTLRGYPTSTSGCLGSGCHSTATGGGLFPALSTDSSVYCDLLNKVADRPASMGGMGNFACTPHLNCPAENDPFVQDISNVGCRNPPSVRWGINGLVRFGNAAYGGASVWSKPGSVLFNHDDPDNTDLTPLAVVTTENGTNYNNVIFAVGPRGIAPMATVWTKGSTTSYVASYWSAAGAYDVWEYGANGTTFQDISLAANATVHPAGTPFGLRRYNGKSIVVYRGTNNQMQGLFWDGNAWSWESFPSNPPGAPTDNNSEMSDDPTAFRRSSTADSFIYRGFGCADCIGEYRIASGVYYRGTLTTPTDIVPYTHVRGLRDASATPSIFAMTQAGIVWFRASSSSDTTFAYNTTNVTTTPGSSSPVPFLNHAGQLAVAWLSYVNGTSTVHLTTYNGTKWTDVNLTSKAGTPEPDVLTADPAAYVSSDGRDTIVYRGNANQKQAVYQLELNGSTWTRTQLF